MSEHTAELVRLWPLLDGPEQHIMLNCIRANLQMPQENVSIDSKPVDVGDLMTLWNQLENPDVKCSLVDMLAAIVEESPDPRDTQPIDMA